jgi:hypothetical protein
LHDTFLQDDAIAFPVLCAMSNLSESQGLIVTYTGILLRCLPAHNMPLVRELIRLPLQLINVAFRLSPAERAVRGGVLDQVAMGAEGREGWDMQLLRGRGGRGARLSRLCGRPGLRLFMLLLEYGAVPRAVAVERPAIHQRWRWLEEHSLHEQAC